MKLKVLQSAVGRFDLFSIDQSFEFSLAIVDDNEKVIELDGLKCLIRYSGEPEDKVDFNNPIENLEDVFDRCYDYADSVISSANLKGQCFTFAKVLQDNYNEINEFHVKRNKVVIQAQIDKLKRELEYDTIIPDISYILDHKVQSRINLLNRWINQKELDLSQVKEGSDFYQKLTEKIDDYKSQINSLENLIKTPSEL